MKITILCELAAIQYSKEISNKSIFVSITCPNEDNVKFAKNDNILDVINLKFNDLDEDYEINGVVLEKPSQEDMNGLKDFVDKYKDDVDEIVIHCGAGASRSPGLGKALIDYLNDDSIECNIDFEEYDGYNKRVCSLCKNEFGIGKDLDYFESIFG